MRARIGKVVRLTGRAVAAGLLLCGAVAPASDGPASSRSLHRASIVMAKGNRALEVGNLRRAGSHFSKALELVPGLPEGHMGLGRILLQRRRFDEALAEFLEAERCYLEQNSSLLELSRQRYNEARTKSTKSRRRLDMLRHNVELFETAIAQNAGQDTGRQREMLRTLQNDVRRLETELLRLEAVPAPATEPGAVPGRVFFFKGNALLRLDRLRDAVEAWEACAATDPASPLVYNNLAVAYWKLGRLDPARENLKKAEELGFEVNSGFRADLDRALSARQREAQAEAKRP